MRSRPPVDHKLVLKMIPVRHADGRNGEARAEGNNAAWSCSCGTLLVGRCYFQFGDSCYTQCPECRRKYRVTKDASKRAGEVVEEAA